MATKVGYIRQDPTEAINWAEVGANFSGILKEEARVREEKKAEIDRATREMERVLKDSPMGDSKNMNEWSLKYASDAQQQLLMVNTLLKSGQLKPKDYTVIRQNLADGTDQAFTLVQEYQDEYSDKMARMKAKYGDIGPDGKPIIPSQELEQFLMGTAEGFGNFNASELVINPTSGNVMVGFRNENGEIESDPNKLVGINNLRNRIKSKFDLYDMQGAITKAKAETFGQFQIIDAKIGTLYSKGLITTMSAAALRNSTQIDDLVKKGYLTKDEAELIGMQAKTEDLWAESQLSNVYNVTSLLTNNLGGMAPNGQPYKFTFKADEEDDNTILLQQVDGAVVPNFESAIGKAHKQTAKDGLLAATRGALDVQMAGQAISGTTPPQQQPWQALRGDEKETKKDIATAWNQLYYGTNAEKKVAIESLNGMGSLKRDDLVSVKFSNDGRSVSFKYGDSKYDRTINIPENISIEDWAALGSELHGVSDKKEAMKLGGGSGTYNADFSNVVSSRAGNPPPAAPPLTQVKTYYSNNNNVVNWLNRDNFYDKNSSNVLGKVSAAASKFGGTVSNQYVGNKIIVKNAAGQTAKFNTNMKSVSQAQETRDAILTFLMGGLSDESAKVMIQKGFAGSGGSGAPR